MAEPEKTNGMHPHVIRFCAAHRRRSASLLRRAELYRGQPPILYYLHQNDGCIQRELAALCHLQPASITSVLAAMERAGLIERRSDPADRRTQRVFLTEKGREKYRLALQALEQVDRECFAGFSEEELALLLRLFDRMAENLLTAEEKDPGCAE